MEHLLSFQLVFCVYLKHTEREKERENEEGKKSHAVTASKLNMND